MSLEGPTPLKSALGGSSELAQALHALRDGAADQARIARVAQKLGPLLDAPPPVSPAQWLGHGLFKSLAAKLTASALVVAAATAWLTRAEVQPDVASAPPALFAAVPSIPATPRALEPAVEPLPVGPSPDGVVRVEPQAESARVAVSSPRAVHARHRVTSSLSANTRERSLAASRAPLQSAAAAPAAEDSEPAVQEEAEAVLPEPPPAAPAPAAPLPSEVDLLFGARKQLRTDPSATLRTLDEHAARFPNGMLAPEREVLAIEALRKLGRAAEAEQRLIRFRAHHPDSPHLRTLR